MDVFIARQPIFNRKQEVFGYELLFRQGLDNYFDFHDLDQAAERVIGDGAILFGIDTLTRGKKAFINLTRAALLKDYPALLPKDLAILELLETVEPDQEVIDACRALKNKGYTIALDDFVYSEAFESLLEVVDLIKVDFLATSKSERRDLFHRLAPAGKRFLAEKVETQDVYQEAFDIGYHYFQGYFFSKPVILSKRQLSSNKLNIFRVLKEIHQPGVDFKTVEEVISQDLTLTYKLLRYINSAFFGLHSEVRSIKHALVLLGQDEIKKWATLVSLGAMSNHKPMELMLSAAVRGKMCENLCMKAGMERKASDFFLLGLFSMIDAILDRQLVDVLADLPLARELKQALIRVTSNPYRAVLEIVLAYERGDWPAVSKWSAKLSVEEQEIPQMYLDAVDWSNRIHR